MKLKTPDTAIKGLRAVVTKAERGLTVGLIAYPIAATIGTLGAALRHYATGAAPQSFTFHAIAAWGLPTGATIAAIAGAGIILLRKQMISEGAA